MAIHADLRDFPLAEMLFFLGNRQSSGRLVVTPGGLETMFTLYAGNITTVESSDPRQRLGQYLLRNGTVAQPALKQLLDQQRDHPEYRAVGELIVEQGLADPATISQILDARVVAILAEILLRDDGRVTFEHTDIQPRGIQAATTTAQQIFEGLRLADENGATHTEEALLSAQWPEVSAELVPFADDDVQPVGWDHPSSDVPLRESGPTWQSMPASPTAIRRLSHRFREFLGLSLASLETKER